MKQRVKTLFDNMQLKNKVIVIGTIVLAFIGSVAVICYSIIVHKYNQLLYQQAAGSLTSIIREIESHLLEIDKLGFMILSDATIQLNLESMQQSKPATYQRNEASNNIYRRLHGYYSFDKYLQAIHVISGQEEIRWGARADVGTSEPFTKLEQACRAAKGSPVWVPTGLPDGSVYCGRQIRGTRNLNLQELGFVYIRVDLGKLVAATLSTSQSNPSLQIQFRGNGSSLYPYDKEPYHLLTFNSWSSYTIQQLQGETMFITGYRIDNPSWDVFLLTPYHEIFSVIVISKVLFVVAVVAAIFFSIMIASGLMKGTEKKIQALTHKIDKLKDGEFPLSIPEPTGKNELNMLNIHFDLMAQSLRELIDDNYVKKLAIKEAQLKELEQQVNPHFLYNTLESINWRAKRCGAQEISTMVEALGKLLRASISVRSELVPLSFELDTTRSYLEIQRLRYEDRLYADICAEEESLNCLVPKMIIQPLVENAIKYSIDQYSTPNMIQVKAERAGNVIQIAVENTGSEIPLDILEQLESGTLATEGTGIGMFNIQRRIQLICGEEYGLRVQSGENRTSVQIILPLQIEQDEQV